MHQNEHKNISSVLCGFIHLVITDNLIKHFIQWNLIIKLHCINSNYNIMEDYHKISKSKGGNEKFNPKDRIEK